MTEEMPSVPGWVDEQLDALFLKFPPSSDLADARQAYAACLASRKQPGTPSDLLGAEFNTCRVALHRAFQSAGIDAMALDPELEALEAEIAADS